MKISSMTEMPITRKIDFGAKAHSQQAPLTILRHLPGVPFDSYIAKLQVLCDWKVGPAHIFSGSSIRSLVALSVLPFLKDCTDLINAL